MITHSLKYGNVNIRLVSLLRLHCPLRGLGYIVELKGVPVVSVLVLSDEQIVRSRHHSRIFPADNIVLGECVYIIQLCYQLSAYYKNEFNLRCFLNAFRGMNLADWD